MVFILLLGADKREDIFFEKPPGKENLLFIGDDRIHTFESVNEKVCPSNAIVDIIWSPNGKHLAVSGAEPGVIEIRDITTNKIVKTLAAGFSKSKPD